MQLQALLYSLNTPTQDTTTHFGSDFERICIDTGASACISTRKENFTNLNTVNHIKINSIGTGLPVAGIGTLKWPIRDDDGHEIDLHVHNALYVPEAPMGLLCPQQIAMQTKRPGDGFNALAQAGILTVEGYKRSIPYDPRCRLPILHTIDGATCYMALHGDTPSNTPQNLTNKQKLLLRWHNRLSHMNFSKLQDLARQGKLPKTILGCDPPLCRSCQFGKAHRRPTASPAMAHSIDAENLQPGDKISVDQLQSSTPGYVDVFKGKPATAKYHAASVYVDHASRYTYIKCHFSTGSQEALEGKYRFEQMAATHGVKVKAYRADNGIMACHDFVQHVNVNQQTISYCGVNAHGQNGIAERSIRTVCDRARTMLLHAMEHWPEAVSIDLWPFALKMAADIHNATPGPSGLSPEEIFTQQKSRPDRLLDFHTFGCPVFVLNPSLKQGQKIPKWHPRSRQAVYLGHSPRHAQTVPIVLNLQTGLCSPQYHVVFDDYFTTTQCQITNELPPTWNELFTHNRLNVLDGEPEMQELVKLSSDWDTEQPSQADIPTSSSTPAPEGAVHTELSDSQPIRDISTPHTTTPVSPIPTRSRASHPPVAEDAANNNNVDSPPTPRIRNTASEGVPQTADHTARTGWNANYRHNTRFRGRIQANLTYTGDQSATAPATQNIEAHYTEVVDQHSAMVANLEQMAQLDDGTINFSHPLALQNDVLHYGGMLKAEDRPQFVTAMQDEMTGLQDILQVVLRSSLPQGTTPLPAIWAFKRKRLPDWTILKHKARINVHGGKQKHGVNYWETYAR
jgi:hypothetical protein